MAWDLGPKHGSRWRWALFPVTGITWLCTIAVLGGVVAGSARVPALAQAAAPDQRPYDDKLMRLSEILGAVHFLRELCGGNDGMLWRDRMVELMNAESSSALRRVRLTRAFNAGYKSYSRTYTTCTTTAQGAIKKFIAEATAISDELLKLP